jgi:prophage regulatory protein
MSERIIRFPELRKKIGGLSTVTVWRWEKEGTFPKRIKLGRNAVGWIESEVDAWIEQRAKER